MHKQVLPGLEYLGAPRAESAPDLAQVTATINGLAEKFEAFKATHATQIEEIKKGREDVLTSEQLDRINAALTDQQGAMNELNAKLAASRLGVGDADGLTPEAREHKEAFAAYFHTGEPGNLKELAVKAALSSGDDSKGGYTVPKEVEQQIDSQLGMVSAMRRLAQVRTIGTKKYTKLVNKHGSTSGWVGETDARPETDGPTLSELEFNAYTLYARPSATEELLDDSAIDIGAWLADEVQFEFAEQEGDAHINGNGVNKPRGILQYDKVANGSWAWGKIGYVATGASGAFDGTDPADVFYDVIYGLKAGYRPNAKFLSNDATTAEIRKIQDGNGNYMWQPSLQAGQPAMLAGYAHESDDNMPDIGADSYSIAFGDFMRGYLIVDRQGIRTLRDPYSNAPYVDFYTTKRTGGGVQNYQAIKLIKFGS